MVWGIFSALSGLYLGRFRVRVRVDSNQNISHQGKFTVMADSDHIDRPPKRPKVITNIVPDGLFSPRIEFRLRLSVKHLTELAGSNPILISLENFGYLRFNSIHASYLSLLYFFLLV